MEEPSKWCVLSGEPEAAMDVALCCGFSGIFRFLDNTENEEEHTECLSGQILCWKCFLNIEYTGGYKYFLHSIIKPTKKKITSKLVFQNGELSSLMETTLPTVIMCETTSWWTFCEEKKISFNSKINLNQAEWSHLPGMHMILKLQSGLCIQRGSTGRFNCRNEF